MIVLLGLLQLVTPAASRAASVAAADSVGRAAVCWRARPFPRCRWLLLTEFGMSSSSQDAYSPRADIALGLMRNIGPRAGVGAAFLFSGDESHNRSGFIVRYRRWLDPSVALEIGAGPVRVCESQGPEGCGPARQSGVQVETAVHLSGLVAATATFEHLGARRLFWPTGEFRTDLPQQDRLYLGVKGGAYMAPIAVLGLGILVAATWN